MPATLLRALNLNESRSQQHTRIQAIVAPIEDQGGYLFGVIDLRGIDGDTESLLNLFVEQIERSAQMLHTQSHLQHRFEQIVQGMNERIAQAATEEQWDFGAGEVNILIGIAGEDQLYLTGAGDLTALFLHRNEEQRYKVFNLFRGIQTEQHIPEWQKLLSVVLDGDLHPGDVFLVGNREIPQQVDTEDLHQILVTLPPGGAAEKIRQYFPAPIDIGLLILRAEEASDMAAMEVSGAESSLDHFARTKDTTSRMLEHQRPRKQDWITGSRHAIRTITLLLISSFNVALALLMGLVKSLLSGAKQLSRSDRKHAWGSLQSGLKERMGRPRISMRHLPTNNKRLVSVIGIVALIFALVIAFSLVRKNRQREQAAYRNLVQDIEQTFDTASASIIYKDEDQARTLLIEGLASIAQLPQNTKDRQAKAQELHTQFDSKLNDLRHAVEVTQLQLLASLPEGETAALMGFDNETAYAFTLSGAVFRYSADASSFDRLSVQAPENFSAPIRARYDDLNDLLYLFDGRQIARFDPDQETYELVTIEGLTEDAVDIEYFAQRIYALSPENEQVYRHDRSGSDFGSGSGWIQARTIPLRDAISLSIDGSVWVLKSDGRIVRYQKGFEEAWPNPTIDPALPASTMLWTTDQITSLYLIDREGARLVQIDKEDGTLLAQLQHSAFENIHGMWEANDLIYVLTPAGLHQFNPAQD